jgi:phosphatidylinositol kinase/protein kinase (PI-3  family)
MILTVSFSGHEDLRQDERVMQLFGLVNTLLSVDTNSFKRRLHIQRYPVIPLAPNAGLLGAVRDSDTLHVLIRDYRDSRKVLLNIEYRLMLQVCAASISRKFSSTTASVDGTRLRELDIASKGRSL